MDEQEFFDDLVKIVMEDEPMLSERSEKLLGINDGNRHILMDLYFSLIFEKGVTLIQLFNCVVTNRLDKLIMKKNQTVKLSAYISYRNEICKIGPTYDKTLTPTEKMLFGSMKIFSDNHCPSCRRDGYLNSRLNEVCVKCGIYACKKCASKHYEDEYECFIHNEIEMKTSFTKGIMERIETKVSDAKDKDKKQFHREGNITVKDVCNLIDQQNQTCAICKDPVLLDKYAPYCLYQFTIDRKNNKLPHDKGNCQISCFYCNCRIWKQKNVGTDSLKICENECHTRTRKLPTKYDVSRY